MSFEAISLTCRGVASRHPNAAYDDGCSSRLQNRTAVNFD